MNGSWHTLISHMIVVDQMWEDLQQNCHKVEHFYALVRFFPRAICKQQFLFC